MKPGCTLAVGCLLLGLAPPLWAQYELEIAFPNLIFTRPVDLQHAGDGSNRLFVVEQAGVIRVFPHTPGVAAADTFLDIRGRVNDSGNEEGLLGLAFHPNYESNGFFYVNYTAANPRRTVIARYRVSAGNPNRAEAASEFILLTINQPYENHNGGQLAFGPHDGYLYIGMGDGGSGGDPQNNGQDRRTLLGDLLRIDVDNPSGGRNYGIPADNPFVGNTSGYREEIFAWGFRNPWRFSFDPQTGWLWLADVGQNSREEIDIVEKGKNYGWRIMEGKNCYDPPSGCNQSGLALPIWDYGRSSGASVTGGYVYRGTRVAPLVGAYIYGDFVSGRIWALRYDGVNPPNNSLLIDTNLNIASFGVDQNNELYLCAFDGRLYRFKAIPVTAVAAAPLPAQARLAQNYPNPFNPATTIRYTLAQPAMVVLDIYNLAGERIKRLVQAQQDAGEHEVVWHGSDEAGRRQAGGVYFYRLQIGDGYVETRRMTFLK
ncbi:MAG: PQQ-dependent sugar dehydrogenase [candidate division KSB1 bacterium]|nr:PQQ-dependent sugar dehydrogenase [candidate division KSB1 bacterium]MDZ7273447.1 PQQ-dependent sugar dehydrogenase [candidate division KSB1 bacterium]MDZ7286961.1 PQQ-dependent sugar dehydrogenase [candidate division KSB1 bacterium]MDZ7299686.1 PQQ-dependent sugar dehydrogenase [candidate division KSB1 bacterium]MDZ7307950.1 PQQ-dependent sugar dehydrogenase [candidate division KSB1 bacterium]